MLRSLLLSCLICLAAAAAAADPRATPWQTVIDHDLPLMGEGSWIVIADAAYPWFTNDAIKLVPVSTDHLAVLKILFATFANDPHLQPMISTDAELPFVAERDAPGITHYRDQLARLLGKRPRMVQPHAENVAAVNRAATFVHVIVLKTPMTLPYTAIFLRLDNAYWSPDAERRLRAAMQEAANAAPAPAP